MYITRRSPSSRSGRRQDLALTRHQIWNGLYRLQTNKGNRASRRQDYHDRTR